MLFNATGSLFIDRRNFERICTHWQHYGDKIPIQFFLGFYVSLVITRWWNQFQALPWPDSTLGMPDNAAYNRGWSEMSWLVTCQVKTSHRYEPLQPGPRAVIS